MSSRRDCIRNLSTIGIMSSLSSFNFSEAAILNRPIPSTNESLAVIGLGTWRVFDVGESEQERSPLKGVLKALHENGGQMVDSSPMYGQSEKVVGDLAEELKLNDSLFVATKIWTSGLEAGKRQIQDSFRLLKRKKLDLLQIHNLVDWQTHLKTLQTLKDEGKVRYIGLTHYTDGMHSTLADIIKRNKVDFVQVNYNIQNRNAERELFVVAQTNGVAVIVNRPFEEGALFQRVKGRNLPEWVAEFDCNTWSQFFLKFIISHPAVNCTIPGTSKVSHMLDNLQAGFGRLPNSSQREKMIQFLNGL